MNQRDYLILGTHDSIASDMRNEMNKMMSNAICYQQAFEKVELKIEIRVLFACLFSVFYHDSVSPEDIALTLDEAEKRAAEIVKAYECHPNFTARIVRKFKRVTPS